MSEAEWTPAHDSLYFWTSEHRQEIADAFISKAEIPVGHSKPTVIVREFIGEVQNARYVSSRPDVVIIADVMASCRSTRIGVVRLYNSLGEREVREFCDEGPSTHIFRSAKFGPEIYPEFRKEEKWNWEALEVYLDGKAPHLTTHIHRVAEIMLLLELKPSVKSQFGNTLAQCQRHKNFPVPRGELGKIHPVVVLITPTSTYDSYFLDQGVEIFHPDWVYISSNEKKRVRVLDERIDGLLEGYNSLPSARELERTLLADWPEALEAIDQREDLLLDALKLLKSIKEEAQKGSGNPALDVFGDGLQ